MKPIKIEIDASKLDRSLAKAHGEKRFYRLVAWPNKNGPDEWGNTHYVKQDLPKDAEKKQMPIIGNLKLGDAAPMRPMEKDELPLPPKAADEMAADEIPF